MISLLCSVYNSEKHLSDYLNYVNNQTLKEFEIIFVDANSTDSSLSIIKTFNFREGIQVKIIECTERIGIYEAWNLAIKNSKYDWVMNYNTDDKIFPSTLSVFKHYIKNNLDADAIYSNCLICDDINHKNIIGFYNWRDANILNNLIQHGCCAGPFPVLKKSSVEKAGYFNPEFTISGDYEMWCRMKSLGFTFKKIDEFLGVYYHNPTGMSTNRESEHWQEHVRQDIEIRKRYS